MWIKKDYICGSAALILTLFFVQTVYLESESVLNAKCIF